MTGGTYVLVCDLATDHPVTITFGAAGERDLPPGSYAYVGSALGPGGFARIDRHRVIAANHRGTRHWHIDYLLGHDDVSIADVLRLVDEERECEVARSIPGVGIDGIGASDCHCSTHLTHVAGPTAVRSAIGIRR